MAAAAAARRAPWGTACGAEGHRDAARDSMGLMRFVRDKVSRRYGPSSSWRGKNNNFWLHLAAHITEAHSVTSFKAHLFKLVHEVLDPANFKLASFRKTAIEENRRSSWTGKKSRGPEEKSNLRSIRAGTKSK